MRILGVIAVIRAARHRGLYKTMPLAIEAQSDICGITLSFLIAVIVSAGPHMLTMACLFETPSRLGSHIFQMKHGRRQGCLVNLAAA